MVEWRARLGVVVALTGALLCGGIPAGAGEEDAAIGPTTVSDDEGFYRPPRTLRKARPGTLIRSAPLVDAPAGAKAWKVLYHSRAANGGDVAVSGIVVAPGGPAAEGDRPVVSVGLGTRGLADVCATSRAPAELLASPLVGSMLDAGYVLAITDYEGLGTPGLHPYGSGESTGRNVIDAARVARHLRDTHAGRRVLFGGHSEGGHAALFAAGLAARYAPELEVLGVFGIAPPTDLVTLVSKASTTPGFLGYAVMFVRGFETAYPKAARRLVLTPQASTDSAVVERDCIDGVLARYAAAPVDAVFRRDPADVPVWRNVLERNSLRPGRVDVPILLVKGDADELLPKAFTDQYVDQLCTAGDEVDYRVYPGASHVSVLPASAADVGTWLADRIAGSPLVSTC